MISNLSDYLWAPAPARLTIPPADVISLFAVDLDLVDAADLSALSPAEAQRATRFHAKVDQQHFIASRLALRGILAAHLNVAPEDLVFANGSHGKPQLAGPYAGDLEFNLSHSGDHLLLGIAADRAIGVDLEEVHNEVEMEPLAEHYFPPELQWQFRTARVQERSWAFFEAWTALEACNKADGRGLHDDLAKTDLAAWQVKNLRIADRFAAAVSANFEFQLRTYTWPS